MTNTETGETRHVCANCMGAFDNFLHEKHSPEEERLLSEFCEHDAEDTADAVAQSFTPRGGSNGQTDRAV